MLCKDFFDFFLFFYTIPILYEASYDQCSFLDELSLHDPISATEGKNRKKTHVNK